MPDSSGSYDLWDRIIAYLPQVFFCEVDVMEMRSTDVEEERRRVGMAKRKAAAFSVLSNTTLVLAKLIVGLLINSVSVIAEAIHSGLDLVAALIAYFAVRTSSQPPDREHEYGHGKIENVSGTIEAVLIFIAALWIAWEAVDKLIRGATVEVVGPGIAVMALSVILNTLVSRYLMKVAKRSDSVALQADALHLSTDVITSLGVLGGLVAIQLTGQHLIDPLAAILVAMIIMRAAYQLTKDAFLDLLDRRLPQREEELIASIINAHRPKVVEFHNLRTRKAGPERHIDMHVVFPRGTSLQEAHGMCDHLEESIARALPNSSVVLHVEPCADDCQACADDDCEAGQPSALAAPPRGGTNGR